jgi:shikimate kinase
MSGVGKTYLGKYISEALGLLFFDTDEIIRQKYNSELNALVKARSWYWFRHEEHVILEELLTSGSDRIISTGGGIIENPLIIPLLKKGIVIYIKRDVSEATKAARCLSKSYDELFKDRKLVYEGCANHVFLNNSDCANFLTFVEDLLKLKS